MRVLYPNDKAVWLDKEFMREDALNEIVWESVKGLLSAAGELKKKIGRKKAVAERSRHGE